MIPHHDNKRNAGFTLIEVLVVVALLGLIVTLLVVNIERDLDQTAELEAKRFRALIEHARDESLLSGRPYAVQFDEAERSYRFLIPGEPWQVVTNDDVLRKRQLPEGIALRLDVREADAGGQLLVVDGLGSITPFVLVVSGDSKEYLVTIDAAQNVQLRTDAPL